MRFVSFSRFSTRKYIFLPSYFFSSPFSLSPCCTANKPISAFIVFVSLLRLQFLDETLWGTRLLVNGRMWDPGSTYMGIRGLNEFHPSFHVFSVANLTGKTMYNCEITCILKKQNKNHVSFKVCCF